MASPSKAEGRLDDAGTMRDEWLRRLFDLTGLVRNWAEEFDWSTRQIEKRMKDSRLGVYEALAVSSCSRGRPECCWIQWHDSPPVPKVSLTST